MAETPTTEKTTNGMRSPLKLDALIIGAGVAGLYQLYRLRGWDST
jgi:acetone monooxygenase